MLRNVRVYAELQGEDGLSVFVQGEAPDGKQAHLRINEEGRLIRHRHEPGSQPAQPIAIVERPVEEVESDGPPS